MDHVLLSLDHFTVDFGENEGFCLGMDRGQANQRLPSGAGMALSYD